MTCRKCYTLHMTKLLMGVVADVRALPEDEQDRVAAVLITFLSEPNDFLSMG